MEIPSDIEKPQDTANILASFTSLQKSTQAGSDSEPSKKCATNSKRKLIKESKFKELSRMCLYQPSSYPPSSSSNHNQIDQQQPRCKQNLIKFIARDFLTDGRQRLEFDTFKKLLILFNKRDETVSFKENLAILEEIYQLIKSDFNLCNKFSAFLTSETALHFGLFTQYSQYEKCHEFLQKLELFIPNKCTFKKLVSFIISSCNGSYETETVANKIEDIKVRIKAITKNNPLINFELDYLFDQRWSNLEPSYEHISLVEVEAGMPGPFNGNGDMYLGEECIDLTLGMKQKLLAAKVKKAVRKKPMARIKGENTFVVALKKHMD